MDLTLTLSEAAALLKSLADNGIHIINVQLKIEEKERILAIPFLDKHLLHSIEKSLTSHLPSPINDVNLEIFSYLSDNELSSLFTVSKDMYLAATNQEIWRHRIKRRFDIDVGRDSAIVNHIFYQQLLLGNDIDRLIVVIRGGFLHLLSRFWPINQAYLRLVNNNEFLFVLKQAIDEENIELLSALIKQDIAGKNSFGIRTRNTAYDVPIQALLGEPDHNFRTDMVYDCNIIALAMKKQKHRVLIALFKEFSDPHLPTIVRVIQLLSAADSKRYLDILLKVFVSTRNLDILQLIVSTYQLTTGQADKIFTLEFLDHLPNKAEDLSRILIGCKDQEQIRHIVAKISASAVSVYLLRGMAAGDYPMTYMKILAEAVNKYYEVCTIKIIKLCFDNIWFEENCANWKALSIILSYATEEIAPKLARYASKNDKVDYFFQELQKRPSGVKKAFLDKLEEEELKALLPKTEEKLIRQKMIGVLLKQ